MLIMSRGAAMLYQCHYGRDCRDHSINHSVGLKIHTVSIGVYKRVLPTWLDVFIAISYKFNQW